MNLTEDCIITFKEPVFVGGSFYRGRCKGAKYIGDRTISGKILKESYGSTGQHTFTILVDSCTGENSGQYKKGAKVRRKGRNLYPNVIDLVTPNEEKYQQLQQQKKLRKELAFSV